MRASAVTSWLGRFLDPLPISADGAFRLTAARDAATGRECVVVTLAPATDPELARAALDRLHAAHASLRSSVVAGVLDRGSDRDYVALDCPARMDLAGLLMIARAAEVSIGHGAADGFIVTLRDALFAAMDHPGGPLSLGALGYGNVLFATDGRFWLAGFGHNVVVADENGRMGGRSTVFQAPEVAVGGRATRSSEFVMLLLFMRSLVPFMRLEPAIIRVLAGNSLSEDLELVRKLLWFERRVLTALPDARASVQDAITTSDRIRELLGVRPDVNEFRAAIARLLAERHVGGPLTTTWRVAADGSSIQRSELAPIVIPGRGSMARIVRALAIARVERPGSGLSVVELFQTGWPGERVGPRSARNRVHVAVSAIRKLGIGADIESNGGTYRIHPGIVVELTGADHQPPATFTRP